MTLEHAASDYTDPKNEDSQLKELHQAGVLPPWLWFWLVTYLLILPSVWVYHWQETIQPMLSPQPLPAGIGGPHTAIMLVLPGFTELLPIAMLLLGVLCVFMPHLRRRRVEHRYNLAPPSTVTPALKEIIEIVREYAPGVEVKVNLKRADQVAFTYATGYRRSEIAIFGGLLKLWRSDREAARAVLLHELGHCRHGDVLMVGAGSFFETLLDAWLPFLVVFFLVPSVVVYVGMSIGSLQEHWQMAQQLNEINRQAEDINAQLRGLGIEPVDVASQGHWVVGWLLLQARNFFTVELPGSISIIISLLVLTPVVIATPLMATWCAEFNADQFVVAEQQSPEPLLRGLALVSPSLSRWTWLTSRLSHPPTKLRQWMAQRGRTPKPLLVLLLLFPLTYVAKLILLNVRAIAALAIVFSPGEMLQTLLQANATGLRTLAPFLLGTGVVLLLYPKLAVVWERLFCQERRTANPASYKEYAIAAAITGGLGILAYGLAGAL
jgi:Zn-dependent protease with chaperone function